MSEIITQAPGTPGNDELMKSLGLIERVSMDADEGRAVMAFEARPEMCHSGNIVQGGFVTGWIDAAMAHAIIVKTEGALLPLSLDIKIAFYAAAHPGRVVAECWIERLGKSTAFAEGSLKDEDGRLIAKGMSTIRLVPARRG